ncbi:MAG: TIGR03560 family F420-dependent LLM class oxidoreductase [Deltaproteobacteria bacterium]|nr:TIGR03560 family F420-dependent LLM class oxidoreductase [Deltaproteobacteria bacterium]
MASSMQFGGTLPQIKRSWQEARAVAEELDALGFHSAWVCDHVYGVPAPNLPIFEAWTELAAVAAVTSRIELGTLVTPPFFRNPAILAKQIATLDHISGGRAIVGLGAGWFEAEFRGTGSPFPALGERMKALEETAILLRRLLSEERVTFQGRHFSVSEAWCEPKPLRRTPILIGGAGEKVLLRIAAQHADIWNNLAVFQAQLPAKIEALRRRCDDVKRDIAEIRISQQCVVVIEEDEARARESLEKAKKIYGGHMGGALEEHGIWGTPERVIDCIERHRKLGCGLLVIEFFGRDTRVPARLFAERVLPAFSGA